MTPKDALNYLENRMSKLALNHKIGNRDIANLEVKDVVMGIETHVMPIFEQALTELEELKRYPTIDDVCKALSEYYKHPVIFDNDTKEFIVTMTHPIIIQYSITEHKNGCVRVQIDYLKPHLITLISRFYEGLEKVGKEE